MEVVNAIGVSSRNRPCTLCKSLAIGRVNRDSTGTRLAHNRKDQYERRPNLRRTVLLPLQLVFESGSFGPGPVAPIRGRARSLRNTDGLAAGGIEGESLFIRLRDGMHGRRLLRVALGGS